MIKQRSETQGNLIALELSGLLTEEDFAPFDTLFEKINKEFDEFRVLLVLNDFHGYTLSGNWAKTKWVYEQMPRITCMAIVGPEKDANVMALAGALNSTKPIEAFADTDLDKALDWVKNFQPEPV